MEKSSKVAGRQARRERKLGHQNRQASRAQVEVDELTKEQRNRCKSVERKKANNVIETLREALLLSCLLSFTLLFERGCFNQGSVEL